MNFISKYIGKLSAIIIAAVSLGLSSEENLSIPNEYGLKIQKIAADGNNVLSEFKETGRLESYTGQLHYPLSSPFGVYVLYLNEDPVAIQLLSPRQSDDKLGVEGITDVLEAHQGQGYGTKLRTVTATFLAKNYFGKTVEISQDEMSSTPLTYAHSCNEWGWGENISSLKSALKAGYRIACLGKYDTVQMLYTRDKGILAHLWSHERTSQLLTLASMVKNPDTYDKDEFKKNLRMFMDSLDFNQEADIVTFLNICMKYQDNKRAESPELLDCALWKKAMLEEVKNFAATLDETQRQNIKNFSKDIRITNVEQKIDLDLLDFCHFNFESFDLPYE
jgi:hypothetical protein